MELLQIALAANDIKQFAKAGRYFEIIDSTYAVQVDFTGANGAQTDSMKNALSGLFLEDPFAHFTLTNGPIAQTVTLLILETGRGGSRRQPGIVRVIDQGADKTNALTQFYGTATQVAVAARLNAAGIKAVTKDVALKRLAITSNVAQSLDIALMTGDPTAGTFSLASQFNNKRLGSAPSAAVKLYQTSAGGAWVLGTELPGFASFALIPVLAGAFTEVRLTTPFVIPIGSFLVVRSNLANSDVGLEVDFEQ